MKVVLQRVKYGKVTVDNKVISEIDEGIVLLWGIQKGDSSQDVDVLTHKIGNLRIFSDEFNKMNKSIQDINGEILLVSQFTLLANTSKGNRPSFVEAESPETAIELLKYVFKKLSDYGIVKQGIFGEDMKVTIHNDGPVTIILESKKGKLKN
ncbi:MAG: D-tyrosyl-tRNA(Tyr) deacylase [Candidatus Actinomarina sp.]|jgi:D-tyrosyl-tRNA(Tyr) deacylase|nr:D-tyrosyl-tRNA(Tyr) deacylase [Actinomycetota bacterium]MBL6833698.1 D-tyrosyl-tRNA(Tyr) deacylase [Candidatus Actinomarina sp.]MBL6837316.1 D-tyrosyl-tRNA(Tyr) deacylase [Candidatus Actinomarina sp.]MDB4823767.1 D-aminoacyl-tRNA deacylase [Acidimicrobiia bacterium]